MLIVFIKEEHVNHLYDVMAEYVATGIMGMFVSGEWSSLTHCVRISFP